MGLVWLGSVSPVSRWILLLVAAMGLSSTLAAQTGEVIPNGEFSFAQLARGWFYWPSPFGGVAGWVPIDSTGSTVPSGSLEVGANLKFPRQTAHLCVPIVGGASYEFSGDILFLGGPPDYETEASLGVTFCARENCFCWDYSPGVPGAEVVKLTTGSSEWRPVAIPGLSAPPDAKSALITAAIQSSYISAQGGFGVQFDNLSLLGPVREVPALFVGGRDSGGRRKGRFAVSATWRAFDGSTGQAQPAQVTEDSGYLWFFWANNVELTVKVLDACNPDLGDRFWVFIAGMTDVEVEVTVEDLVTGSVRQYDNPLGTAFATVTDTEGFPCNSEVP